MLNSFPDILSGLMSILKSPVIITFEVSAKLRNKYSPNSRKKSDIEVSGGRYKATTYSSKVPLIFITVAHTSNVEYIPERY